MPRLSKLSIAQLQDLEVRLNNPQQFPSVKALAMEFHIAPASVFYYRKKFVVTVEALYSARHRNPKPKVKDYEYYLKTYLKSHNKPFVRPPLLQAPDFGGHLTWL